MGGEGGLSFIPEREGSRGCRAPHKVDELVQRDGAAAVVVERAHERGDVVRIDARARAAHALEPRAAAGRAREEVLDDVLAAVDLVARGEAGLSFASQKERE